MHRAGVRVPVAPDHAMDPEEVSMPLSSRTISLSAGALVIVGLVATYVMTRPEGDNPFAPCQSSAMAGAGAIGGPFTMMDENGKTVTDTDLFTKPSLVYFGYTYCPDICPVDTARNAEAIDILDEKGIEVTPVFISVDPRRDTPQTLKDWTDNVHPRMIGLTGTPDQIKVTAQAYKVLYQVPENPADDSYTVNHTTFSYLMLPGTGFAEVFTRDVTADKMAETIACYVENAR